MPTKTLEEWRAVIEGNVNFVDVKPYSHNIIGLALSAIDGDYGRAEANRAIVDFGLDGLGWSEHAENEKSTTK